MNEWTWRVLLPNPVPRPVGPEECSHGRKAVVGICVSMSPGGAKDMMPISYAAPRLGLPLLQSHGLAAVATFFRPYGPWDRVRQQPLTQTKNLRHYGY
jgi:hypothetical protein